MFYKDFQLLRKASTTGANALRLICDSILKQITVAERNKGFRMSRPRKKSRRLSKKEEHTLIQRPPIFLHGTELQVSTIVDRVPWRPSIEYLPHFGWIIFMTVITAGADDKIYDKKMPMEELKAACVEMFMKKY